MVATRRLPRKWLVALTCVRLMQCAMMLTECQTREYTVWSNSAVRKAILAVPRGKEAITSWCGLTHRTSVPLSVDIMSEAQLRKQQHLTDDDDSPAFTSCYEILPHHKLYSGVASV